MTSKWVIIKRAHCRAAVFAIGHVQTFLLLISLALSSIAAEMGTATDSSMLQPTRHLFFIHNRFLENHRLDEPHPQYGRSEYHAILQAFSAAGLQVHSEHRQTDVNAREYAQHLSDEIRALMAQGVQAKHITVVGTSKGGYIAQYVSTFLNQAQMNFVFIGSFQDNDIQRIPEINFCGRILNIYENSDPFGVSAKARVKSSPCQVERFEEVALNTGLNHGFLFRALDEWLQPAIKWALQP